jgi:protein-disulfide isomerase
MTEEHEEKHEEIREEESGEKHHKTAKTYNLKVNKTTLWTAISVVLFVLLVISIYTGGFNTGSDTVTGGSVQAAQPRQAAAPAQPRPAAPSAPSIDMKTLIDDDTVKGNADAPVTIVEFSDFECPFCERFYSSTLKQIDDTYIKTGKVKLVYRDFPLGFHANAQKAAEAAECAGEQGKFWEMHDALFDNGVAGGVASFKRFATDLGLDTGKFDVCLDTGAMTAEVKKDMADGQRAGVTGTPAFFINGQLVTGAQPFENFRQIIEAELAK